jgi:hypothetical protein
MSKTTSAEDFNDFVKKQKARFRDEKSRIVDDAKLSAEEQDYLQDRLYRMIDYGAGRQDWYEDQRHRFLQIGLGLLAAGAAGAAFVATVVSAQAMGTKLAAWLATICLLGVGLALVVFYNRQTGLDHPYRRVVDIKTWYFKYTFPSRLADRQSRKLHRAKTQVQEIVDSMPVFLERLFSVREEEQGFIKEDLEQVFVLQLLQRYRSQQVKKLSNILSWGLSAFVGLMILSIVFFLVLPSSPQVKSEAPESPGIIQPHCHNR